MTKTYLWKIKPGKRQVWEDWCTFLVDKRYDEAAATLPEENLVAERCFIFGEGDESYVVYLHETVPGKDKDKANLRKEINRTHFAKMEECLVQVKPRVLGYNVEAKTT